MRRVLPAAAAGVSRNGRMVRSSARRGVGGQGGGADDVGRSGGGGGGPGKRQWVMSQRVLWPPRPSRRQKWRERGRPVWGGPVPVVVTVAPGGAAVAEAAAGRVVPPVAAEERRPQLLFLFLLLLRRSERPSRGHGHRGGDEPPGEGGVGELRVSGLVDSAPEHLQLRHVPRAEERQRGLGHRVAAGGLAQRRRHGLSVYAEDHAEARSSRIKWIKCLQFQF